MKLSIIVPVYNAERYLRECLDSLAAQTVDDYEVILINDGSKDGSLSIAESYVNRFPERFRVLTVENGGQGRARNIGIGMARGDYLGFADSDDWVSPDMFEKLYEAAVKVDADMAVCDTVQCFDDGRQCYLPMSRFEEPMSITAAVWNKLFKKSAVEGLRFPEGLWYEDAEYVIKAVLECKVIARVNEGLYFYRCGHVSTMNNKNARKNLDIISIMEDLKAYMLPRGYKDEFEYVLICHLLLDAINRVNLQRGEDSEQVIGELRKYARANIPALGACESFKKQSVKRRIVMSLNYHGLHAAARMMFKK